MDPRCARVVALVDMDCFYVRPHPALPPADPSARPQRRPCPPSDGPLSPPPIPAARLTAGVAACCQVEVERRQNPQLVGLPVAVMQYNPYENPDHSVLSQVRTTPALP